MTAAADESIAPTVWHTGRAAAGARSSGADAAARAKPAAEPSRTASSLRVAVAQMLRAMCPQANEAGIVDVLRDIHQDSILLGVLFAARLASACERILQLTPLGPHELSANVLVCVVLAEKLLNDAPFTDLVAMVAAALGAEVRCVCQLEFRVLSILSVHEGTVVSGHELSFFTATVASTGWRHCDAADCVAILQDYSRRRAVAAANGWQADAASADGLTGDLLAYQRARHTSRAHLGGRTPSQSPPLKPVSGPADGGPRPAELAAEPRIGRGALAVSTGSFFTSSMRGALRSTPPMAASPSARRAATPPAPAVSPLPGGAASSSSASWTARVLSSLGLRLTPPSRLRTPPGADAGGGAHRPQSAAPLRPADGLPPAGADGPAADLSARSQRSLLAGLAQRRTRMSLDAPRR